MARNFLCATALALLLGLSGWALSGAVAEVPDPVVATVNGTEIRRSEVVEARKSLPAQYQQAPFESIFEPLLERIINTRLAAGAGRRDKVHEHPSVRAEIARLGDQVIERVYLDRKVEARLTKEALEARYKESIEDFKSAEEVRARHILLKQKEEAEAVIEELADGADFAELAGTKSTGPSKAQGGDLGFFTRGRMVKPFSDAAFALEKGAYTREPVKTQFGWHVIKLEDRRRTAPPTFVERKPELHG